MVAPSLTIVPPNALAQREQKWERYVVIGAGKTGMDAVLYLLDQGVAVDAISWVVSRDAWLLNRDAIWPQRIVSTIKPQALAVTAAADWRDAYHRLEKIGILMRVNQDIEPTFYRCATVSEAEVEQLRRIQNVVRLGRVQRIEADTIVFDRGELPTGPAVLHVDCTANGLPARPPRPIFEEGRITLQTVMLCQPAMSAALIARVERVMADDATRNRYLRPVPPPEVPVDLMHCMIPVYDNAHQWLRSRHMRAFFSHNRLSLFSHVSLWGKIVAVFTILRWGLAAERAVRAMVAALAPRELPDTGQPAP